MRALQGVVAIACLVPLIAGSRGALLGPEWIRGVSDVSADLDSHFRYMSGIFLGVGVAFVTCIPGIAAKGPRFRLLGALVVAGGCARLISLAAVGPPSRGHIFGLFMELGVVPLLILWQARVARRAGQERA